MKQLLFFICCTIISALMAASANAATLKGRITDSKGEPLPFASLYLKGTTKGTTSNMDGYYQLELPVGDVVLICQYVGYQKQELKLKIADGINTKNIQLLPNEKILYEVKIKSGENPAIAIIKKAIKKRSFYNKQIDHYRANAYIKGNFKLEQVPKDGMIYALMGGGDAKDEMDKAKGILILSETFSEISYRRPDKMKVKVISSRVSGNQDDYGFSDPMQINLYENNVQISEQLSPRGFVSPIADAALLSYKYELLSAYMDDGKLVNRIKVIPRRKFEPLFSGIIDIIENEWRLHSVDLTADKDHQLDVVDTMKIKQVFVPVGDAMMVKDQSFFIKLKIMGFGIVGNYVNVFSDYVIDQDNRKDFNRFVKEYESEANKRSVAYWDTIRPVPLSQEEKEDYVKKDSIAKVEEAKKDSLPPIKNSLKTIVFNGYTQRLNRKTRLFTSSLIGLRNFNWNTAEGLNYTYSVGITKRVDEDHRWNTNLRMRYGVSNQQFNARLNTQYHFGKTNKSTLRLSGGRYVFQYNNAGPVNPLINSAYTLFYGRNYMKIYQAWFGEFSHSYRHISGLSIQNGLSVQDRYGLANTNLFSFRKNEVQFTPNYPVEIRNSYEERHQALLYRFGMEYQPGRKYIKYPDRIAATHSHYPIFGAAFTWGMPFAFSDVDYGKWQLSMRDDMQLNLWGTFEYRIAAGGFLWNNRSYTPDYTHFNGNQIMLASPYLNSFQVSPYYLNSNTQEIYGLLHAEHHFKGLLTNKIPLFRRLKYYLVASTNMYYVNQDNNYMELCVGLENIGYKILRIIRVDGVVGYNNFKNPVYGVRIGISGGVFGFDSADD